MSMRLAVYYQGCVIIPTISIKQVLAALCEPSASMAQKSFAQKVVLSVRVADE